MHHLATGVAGFIGTHLKDVLIGDGYAEVICIGNSPTCRQNNFADLCGYFGLEPVAAYWESVMEISSWSQRRIAWLITRNLFGTRLGNAIAVLGFAFKAETNAPCVSRQAVERDLGLNSGHGDGARIEVGSDLKAAVEGAHAVLILSDGADHRQRPWLQLGNQVRSPGWVFDSCKANKLPDAIATSLQTWCSSQGGL
jgi:UDPglucose 6-dehydrogenase